MPGAQPRRDFWSKLASSVVRGAKASAPGSAKVR